MKRIKSNNVAQAAAVWLATGLGIGEAPFASGTFGALLGIPLAWGAGRVDGALAQAAVVLAVALVGVGVTHVALPQLNRGKDPGCVVLDEIATIPITFYLVPMSNAWVIALGFGLHRLFDITKPPPARRLETLPGAWGVMADDVAAAVYSNVALRMATALFPALQG